MYYIFTEKMNLSQLNAIVEWGQEFEYMPPFNYPHLIDKKMAVAPDRVFVCTYDGEIPEEVIPSKYCYTAANGFYLNPAWIEPPETVESKLNKLDAQATYTAIMTDTLIEETETNTSEE